MLLPALEGVQVSCQCSRRDASVPPIALNAPGSSNDANLLAAADVEAEAFEDGRQIQPVGCKRPGQVSERLPHARRKTNSPITTSLNSIWPSVGHEEGGFFVGTSYAASCSRSL